MQHLSADDHHVAGFAVHVGDLEPMPVLIDVRLEQILRVALDGIVTGELAQEWVLPPERGGRSEKTQNIAALLSVGGSPSQCQRRSASVQGASSSGPTSNPPPRCG